MTLKLAAIVTGPDTYLDHLGAISYIMQMPLFITEEDTYAAALEFYPAVEAIAKESQELDSHFLAESFDAIFESGKFFSMQLAPVIELLHKKKMRFIYCPHGHSDKGHSATSFVPQDVSLVYGTHMSDLLSQTGEMNFIKSTVRTGNYRLKFYEMHRAFYDDLAHKHVSKHLTPLKKTILYAPSWQDGENPSSFFKATEVLIEQLSSEFNLIIKLHPFLKQFHPSETYSILESWKDHPSVLFLERFPCIYPLLNVCDLYIGDYSSIGYDFLSFDRPLYFVLEENAPRFVLHEAGLVIPKGESIKEFILRTWNDNLVTKKEKRENLYTYVFGESKPFDGLKKDILDALEKTKP